MVVDFAHWFHMIIISYELTGQNKTCVDTEKLYDEHIIMN